MREKLRNIFYKLHPKRVTAVFNTFLRDESISGKLILLATLVALVVVNSPLREIYEQFWHINLNVGLGNWFIALDLRHWISEGLMALFFLVVGLEIRRELDTGELRDIKNASLPIAAAIGGMVIPAVVYLAFNLDTDYIRGWGIPIATDIAFAVGILLLLGKKVPVSLKIFLLTLAIADDLGAITVIALFYAEIIHYGFLFATVGLLLTLASLRRFLANKMWLFVVLGLALWATTHLSGIHASIAGALLGMLAPIRLGRKGYSVAEKMEKAILPVSTFIVLPVFAFANAGVKIGSELFDTGTGPIMWGIVMGLVVGKAFGIAFATWLMVRSGRASLPSNTRWAHIIGVGFIAGIGFTVSIFITELAFGNNSIVETAKASIFIASIASALLGYLVLHRTHKREQRRLQVGGSHS